MKSSAFFYLIILLLIHSSFSQTSNETLGGSATYDDGLGNITSYINGINITTGDYNTIIGDGTGGTLSSGSKIHF